MKYVEMASRFFGIWHLIRLRGLTLFLCVAKMQKTTGRIRWFLIKTTVR